MLMREYDAMMEAKGTPKVWCVASGSSTYGSGMVHYSLFLTEEEAKERFNKIPNGYYKKMYRTWDIWNFTKRKMAEKTTQ